MTTYSLQEWHASRDNHNGTWSIETGMVDGYAIVCDLYCLDEETHDRHPYQEDRAEANAHLLAAAPELLAACKAIVAYYTKYPDKYWLDGAVKAREAIAKAEGE